MNGLGVVVHQTRRVIEVDLGRVAVQIVCLGEGVDVGDVPVVHDTGGGKLVPEIGKDLTLTVVLDVVVVGVDDIKVIVIGTPGGDDIIEQVVTDAQVVADEDLGNGGLDLGGIGGEGIHRPAVGNILQNVRDLQHIGEDFRDLLDAVLVVGRDGGGEGKGTVQDLLLELLADIVEDGGDDVEVMLGIVQMGQGLLNGGVAVADDVDVALGGYLKGIGEGSGQIVVEGVEIYRRGTGHRHQLLVGDVGAVGRGEIQIGDEGVGGQKPLLGGMVGNALTRPVQTCQFLGGVLHKENRAVGDLHRKVKGLPRVGDGHHLGQRLVEILHRSLGGVKSADHIGGKVDELGEGRGGGGANRQIAAREVELGLVAGVGGLLGRGEGHLVGLVDRDGEATLAGDLAVAVGYRDRGLSLGRGVKGLEGDRLTVHVDVEGAAVVAGNAEAALAAVKAVADEIIGLKILGQRAGNDRDLKGGGHVLVGDGEGLLAKGILVVARDRDLGGIQGNGALLTTLGYGENTAGEIQLLPLHVGLAGGLGALDEDLGFPGGLVVTAREDHGDQNQQQGNRDPYRVVFLQIHVHYLSYCWLVVSAAGSDSVSAVSGAVVSSVVSGSVLSSVSGSSIGSPSAHTA